MTKARFAKIVRLLIILTGVLLNPLNPASANEVQRVVLFEDDFEDNDLGGWLLTDDQGNFVMGEGSPWQIVSSVGKTYLKGSTHSFAKPNTDGFADGWVSTQFRLINNAAFHFNVRENLSICHQRYLIGINQGGLYLEKQDGEEFYALSAADCPLEANTWHDLKVIFDSGTIQIFINNSEKINYTDTDSPYLFGKTSIESLTDSEVHFDNLHIEGDKFIQSAKWIKTGGPTGGLGYDVRFDPKNPDIMFVTDNPSGINKSYDHGKSWVRKNDGITTRSGETGDDIPIFCLTIDPSNSNIVWAGTQSSRGIYKSLDGGETWAKKDNGITEWNEITFRGFGVDPNNSSVVYAGAEISSGINGYEFDKARGKIFKTTDGGENWSCVWEGDSLVRFVIVDPNDSDVVYASTGIFDREAYNDVGIGILKSTDSGSTWRQINNGLTNLFAGFLEMHPENSKILFAATGMNQQSQYGYTHGGIFKTDDGGESWKHVLVHEYVLNSVVISPSSPNVVYAAGDGVFFSSTDSGETWTDLGQWGPSGIYPGQPIGLAVDPNNSNVVFANNYNGGNFRSSDGGKNWENASSGYTGANLRMIRVNPSNPEEVYCTGRSGTFKTTDSGKNWEGVNYSPLVGNDDVSIACHPTEKNTILVTKEGDAKIYRTKSAGESWEVLYQYPGNYNSENWHTFKAIAYCLSNPSIIYAGVRKVQNIGMIDPGNGPSYGMFKTTDGGQNWKQINQGLEETYDKNINDILIDPQNADNVYIGTYKNGIWKTTNGGSSWVCKTIGIGEIADVRSLAMNPLDNSVIFAGTRDNGIWKTEDGGATWENISLGMPSNAAILSIVFYPPNPQTIFAADLTTGVYISNDSGQKWYLVNDGLTYRAVTSLDISYDGSMLYAATSGGGVYRMSLQNEFACLTVSSDLCINIPCALYNSNFYGFTLGYYVHPDDASGFYWKLNMSTLTTGDGSNNCIPIAADLSMPMECVSYNGTQYGFNLKLYPNPYDPYGLYWMMDKSTLTVK